MPFLGVWRLVVWVYVYVFVCFVVYLCGLVFELSECPYLYLAAWEDVGVSFEVLVVVADAEHAVFVCPYYFFEWCGVAAVPAVHPVVAICPVAWIAEDEQ